MRSAPFEVFAFAMLFPILFVLLGAGVAAWSLSMSRSLRGRTALEVSDLQPGYQLVWGKVASNAQRAPLSGRRCAWYAVTVEEYVRGSTDKDRGGWRSVREETSHAPIRITDGSSTCLVESDGARVYETGWSEWEGDSQKPDSEPEIHRGTWTSGITMTGNFRVLGQDIVARPRMRCRERYLFADDPVFAIGEVEEDVVAVRRKRKTSAGEETPPDAGREEARAFRVRKPEGYGPFTGSRPFLVSAQHPKDIAEDGKLAAQGGAMLAVLGLVTGYFLWRMRYG